MSVSMDRLTVTITTKDNPEPRDFHLSEARAWRFADRVVSEGGVAEVGPFRPSAALVNNLARAVRR